MLYRLKVLDEPEPDDLIVAGAGLAPEGASFARWLRAANDPIAERTALVVGDELLRGGPDRGVAREVTVARYEPEGV